MTKRLVRGLQITVLMMGMVEGPPAAAESRAPTEVEIALFADKSTSPVPSRSAEETPVAAIRATEDLARTLHAMWDASPTFRRQLTRIAADPSAVVIVRRCQRCPKEAWATTQLTIKSGVLLRAIVEIRSLDNITLVETVGHEFEHILEQLDRVDLGRFARGPGRSGHGVQRKWKGQYETERARQVGLAVAVEYRAHLESLRRCHRKQP